MMREHDFWNRHDLEGSDLFVSQGALKFDTRLRVAEIGRHICFGKGGGSAPDADPQVGAAALMQAKTGEDWLAFAKDQFADSKVRQDKVDSLTTEVTTQQLKDMRDGSARSDDQWQRYNTLFKPIEDRMVSDAANYDTPEAQAKAAAEAKADVMSNASQAQQQNQRQMASMGIDPRSGRFAGVDRGTDLSTALASAGAQNSAREGVKATGMALREGVANFGRGATSTAAQQVGLGLQAGNSASGNQLGAENNWRANGQIMAQGFQGAQQGYAGQANALNQQQSIQNQAQGIDNQAAQAKGQQNMAIVGTIGTIALAF
jgi:hypothetical protein